MACTTILVGKKASYDGSTMIARNDDSPSGAYMPKKFVVIHPEDQPKVYESVISHVKIELPENPMRYTAMPNAVREGIWAASGVNEAQVGMTATETITSIHVCLERIRWLHISRSQTTRKKLQVESGKRTLYISCFLISTAQEKACRDLEVFSRNTVLMR